MSTPIFAKLSAELHRHPKARRAGYHGTNVFRVVLELNALHGATGRLSPAHSEPYFIADALMCTEEEAARGVEAAIRARLLELAQDGSLQIVGWDDDEWGRGGIGAMPLGAERKSSTYVVQRGDAGPVKIGRATNVASRLATLQTACAEKLAILHLVPFDIEAELHRRLGRWRMRGEWFSAECMAELAAALRDLAEKGDAP